MRKVMSSLLVGLVGLWTCSNLAQSYSYSMIIKPRLLGHLSGHNINIRYA